MKYLNQRGTSHLVVFLGIAVIAIVAVAGFRVYSQNSSTTETASTPASNNSAPASIKSTSDVNQATKALDSTNVDSSVNPSQVDNDLEAVL